MGENLLAISWVVRHWYCLQRPLVNVSNCGTNEKKKKRRSPAPLFDHLMFKSLTDSIFPLCLVRAGVQRQGLHRTVQLQRAVGSTLFGSEERHQPSVPAGLQLQGEFKQKTVVHDGKYNLN